MAGELTVVGIGGSVAAPSRSLAALMLAGQQITGESVEFGFAVLAGTGLKQ